MTQIAVYRNFSTDQTFENSNRHRRYTHWCALPGKVTRKLSKRKSIAITKENMLKKIYTESGFERLEFRLNEILDQERKLEELKEQKKQLEASRD